MVINKLMGSLGRVSNTQNGSNNNNSHNNGAPPRMPGEESLERNIKTPGERDILLGRGRTSWSHSGNQQFRSFVGLYLKQYTEAKSRNEKTKTVELIYDELIKQGGRFLKMDASTNTWYQVGKSIAREKIAHALRDAIGLRIKLGPTDAEQLGGTSISGAASVRGSSKSTSGRSQTSGSSKSSRKSTNSGSVFTKSSNNTATPKFIQPNESLFVHDNPTPDESISCEKSGSAQSKNFTTTQAAEALMEGPESTLFRKSRPSNRAYPPPPPDYGGGGGGHNSQNGGGGQSKESFHSLVDSMMMTGDYNSQQQQHHHHHHSMDDDDSEFGNDLKGVSSTNRTITSMDDELSTGFSAMSLDNKSIRSGYSFKSGKSGGTGMSAASRKATSAVFELCEDFGAGSSNRFHPVMNAPIIPKASSSSSSRHHHQHQQHHDQRSRNSYGGSSNRNNSSRNSHHNNNGGGTDSMVALHMSLQKREEEAMMRHSRDAAGRHHNGGGGGAPSQQNNDDDDDSFLDCDIFDGMTPDDLSAMGSLDEFSLASKSRASTTRDNSRRTYFENDAMSHQEDTSQKSTETEKEWRKTLLALREN